MTKAFDKLMPALPPTEPADPLSNAADAVASASSSAPLWLGLGLLAALFVLVGALRFMRPAYRLRRAMRRHETRTRGQHPALQAQALLALVTLHRLQPDAAWRAAIERLRFEAVAPAQAEAQLRQLQRQIPRMRRR